MIASHIIAIYPDQEAGLNHAIQFLKSGIDKNESSILITDFLPRERIIDIISSRLDVNAGKLEQNGDLNIATPAEWYLTEEEPSTANFNKIINSWSQLSRESMRRGKIGIRAFGDMTTFFRLGLTDYLVEYEDHVSSTPTFPILGICAYVRSDIHSLPPKKYRRLQDSHNHLFLFP